MIKETNIENLEKADVMPDNLYYYNAVNDAVSIVEQEAGMKYTFRSEKELQEVIFQSLIRLKNITITNININIINIGGNMMDVQKKRPPPCL